SCTMYGIRHLFISQACKRNVNLKALATLVGHTDSRMIERVYIHIDQDYEFLQSAAAQALGCGAESGTVPVRSPDSAAPPPAEAMATCQAQEARLKTLTGTLERKIASIEQPKPTATATPRAQRKKPTCKKPRDSMKLNESTSIAWDAACWAMKENPDLAGA